MDRKLKELLKEEFEPPKPLKKQEFLLERKPASSAPVSYGTFILSQAGYIRKRIWGISFLIFALALLGGRNMEKEMLWSISALMPILALAVLAENGRSEIYGMTELEQSARFSLKSVMLARMGILGTANFILIVLLLLFVTQINGISVPLASVYILCPYLLTIFSGLYAERKVRGKEAVYLSMGLSACISIGSVWFIQTFPTFYMEEHVIWWILFLVVLVVGTVKECYLSLISV